MNKKSIMLPALGIACLLCGQVQAGMALPSIDGPSIDGPCVSTRSIKGNGTMGHPAGQPRGHTHPGPRTRKI